MIKLVEDLNHSQPTRLRGLTIPYLQIPRSDSFGLHNLFPMFSFFSKNGPNPASFSLFSLFSHYKYSTNTVNEKSIDDVLGSWTQGGRMVGTDKSIELWQHPIFFFLFHFLLDPGSFKSENGSILWTPLSPSVKWVTTRSRSSIARLRNF